MDSNQFREAAHSAIEEIISYYDTIQDRRVSSNVTPGYLRPLLPSGPPATGEPWSDIQKDIEAKIMPGLTHWQSPNFMAFFPASSTYPGILGEMYSAAFTAAAFNWACSPAITELETVMMDWLAELFKLPDCFLSKGKGGGIIQGTTSEAIATMVIVARDRYLREATKHLSGEERENAIGEKRGKLIALGSSQSHSSTQKAAMVAGTRYASVPVRIEDGYAMRGSALEATLRECKAKGLEPYYLTATLGSTATCAVDNFEEIAQIKEMHSLLWVHVDAAYAGAALVCPEYQHLTEHFASFESYNMNMHKWLLTNFDACGLWVRDRNPLIDALSISRSYLDNKHSAEGTVIDYRDWQIPLGRRFRSLKIWFILRTYGVEGLRAHIRKHIKLGELFEGMMRDRSDLFDIPVAPAFALTVFSVVSPPAKEVTAPLDTGLTEGFTTSAADDKLVEANALTKRVYELINSRGEIMLTNGVVDNSYVIRFVSANPKADEEHVRNAFQIIVKTAEEVLRARDESV